MRRRWPLIVAGSLVFLFVLAQVLIPGLGEQRIEDRLTRGGGTADVTLGAFPAARLLFSHGERIEIQARDLDLDLNQETSVFDRLDGFHTVDISIDDSRIGPFQLDNFALSRDGNGPYHLTTSGSTSPTALADYGFEQYKLPGQSLVDALLGPLMRDVGDVPMNIDMELSSDDGRIQVVSGGGEIAGFSTGPLAQLLTSAVVVRI